MYTRTLSEPLYSFPSSGLCESGFSSDVFRPFEQIQFTNLSRHCRYPPHTHVVSQPASLRVIDNFFFFFKKIFPNFHNFRSTVSIFPTKRKKNLRETNKWINKYISSSFPRNGEAEMLNWRICPDVYVKRFVICKLSIATCSSGGREGEGGGGER